MTLSYRNGREHGTMTYWYAGGRRQAEIHFDEGRRHGPYAAWFPNGNKQEIGRYNNGRREGVWIEYRENGQERAWGPYKRGRKQGRWTSQNEAGTKIWSTELRAGKALPNQLPGTRASTGHRTTGGTLPKEAIQRVVVGRMSEVQRCYEDALLDDRTIDGRVVYSWTIERDGPVSSAELTEAPDQLRVSRATGCILKVIAKMRFPEPSGGRVAVRYPFAFRVRQF